MSLQKTAAETAITELIRLIKANYKNNADLSALLATKVNVADKGVAGGVASLGSDGLVPASQLPSYVDDVLSYDSLSKFPTSGEAGKIYVANDTNLTYRWSGTAYVEISASLALGETASTAYAGNKGAANASAIATLQSTLGSLLYAGSSTQGGAATSADKVNASISFKNASGTTVSFNGSAAVDLTAGLYYALTAETASKTSNTITLKNTEGKAQAFNGSAAIDLTGGVNYAASSGKTNAALTITINGTAVAFDGSAAKSISIALATTAAAGLMSAADKSKLDNIAAGAQVNTITGVKGDAETSYRVGNVNISPSNVGITEMTADDIDTIFNA